MKVTIEDKNRISKLIEQLESETSSELVVAILPQSDHYPASHYRTALAISFISTTLFYLSPYYQIDNNPLVLLWSMLAGLFIGYFLAFIPVVKKIASTRNELNEESYQKAVELFHHHNVTHTKNRTGILIFFTLLEKRVYILADKGIAEKCPAEFWNEHINTLVNGIKSAQLLSALEAVTHKISELLKKEFPIQADDQNELSNEVISE